MTLKEIVPEARAARGVCSVDGCTRTYRGHGFCRTHYSRWKKHGDPQANVPIRDGSSDNIGYGAAHDRVKSVRGRASDYRCDEEGCTSRAKDWAYDGKDPREKIGADHSTVLRYSADPAHYRPLCRTHHNRFDAAAECIRGHEMTAANSLRRKDGWRRCRTCENTRRRNAARAKSSGDAS